MHCWNLTLPLSFHQSPLTDRLYLQPIGRLYSLPFAPHGFFSRFLVRTLRFCTPSKYWSCGAVLISGDGSEALVELKEGNAEFEAMLSIMVKVWLIGDVVCVSLTAALPL